MVLKLDMENAFDRVKHSFLYKVLERYGFSPEFIDWVSACIGSAWIAPMINSHPSHFFKSSRGLRQGCPLSPPFYILMVDSLSRKLEEEHRLGRLPGIQNSRGVSILNSQFKAINHSQFANDTLLLGATSPIIARIFKRILDSFLIALGGKINISKSRIHGWNIPGHQQDIISRIFGFPIIVN
jgi:hypothetical protein